MSLESKLPESLLTYTKEDLLFDSSYALCVISYITPLTLGAYRGIMNATNPQPNSSLLLPALYINTLGTAALIALNTTEKKLKFITFGTLSATITAPLLYSIGYSIGYCAGKIVY